MNIRRLKQIGSEITGLKITNDIDKDTAFIVIRNLSYEVEELFININIKELNNIPIDELRERGHNRKNLYLLALLHEIAHYKQYKKMNLIEWFTFSCKIQERREEVADRYATRYYKKFKVVRKNE